MWILALDSSSAKLSMALAEVYAEAENWRIKRCLERTGREGENHQEEIALFAQALFQEASLEPRDLQALIVGRGPGSFTGLRIGYGFVKGLAFSLQLPLTDLCSFQTFAWESSVENQKIAVLSDARRDEFFFGMFTKEGSSGMRTLETPRIRTIKEIETALLLSDAPVQLVCVPGSEEALKKCHLSREFHYPAHIARSLIEIRLASKRSVDWAGKRPVDVGHLSGLEPSYLRPVAALTISERKAKTGAVKS